MPIRNYYYIGLKVILSDGFSAATTTTGKRLSKWLAVVYSAVDGHRLDSKALHVNLN